MMKLFVKVVNELLSQKVTIPMFDMVQSTSLVIFPFQDETSIGAPVDTSKTREILKSKKFFIIARINSTVEEHNDLQNIDEMQIQENRLKSFEPYCKYMKVYDNSEYRYPRRIAYAVLVDKTDIMKCRPVIRSIIYIEQDRKATSHFDQNLYRLRKKRYVISYEAVKR